MFMILNSCGKVLQYILIIGVKYSNIRLWYFKINSFFSWLLNLILLQLF